MQASTIGRVRNVKLPTHKPLLPLFEAIVNALDSVEEHTPVNGKVCIKAFRDDDLPGLTEDSLPPINGFEVIDNGTGFDNNNYDSFNTSDSRYKEAKGAKGIGRFLWLKAFDFVEIESHYQANSHTHRRRFDFRLTDAGVEDPVTQQLTKPRANETCVRLTGFKKEYKEKCPRKLVTVGRRIVEHCLVYFLQPDCPTVELLDGSEKLVLNDLFREEYQKEAETQEFDLKSQKFLLYLFKVSSAEFTVHRLHYVANRRDVQSENLERFAPDLRGGLELQDGGTFYFAAYLSGSYLDHIVNSERTRLEFPSGEEDLVDSNISEKEIRDELTTRICGLVETYVAPVREEKMRKIKTYIDDEAPKYKPLFKYASEQIQRIPASLVGAPLEAELARVQFQVDQELRENKKKILGENDRDITTSDDYKRKLLEFIEKYDDVGKAKLAEYVAHRRVVLEFLDQALQRGDDGKYANEDAIHDLVCPRRTTSDDTDYESLNLWVVDERLSYHFYLASDMAVKKVKSGKFNGIERPDVAIFNRPIAFAEGETPYETVIILEFKRPARDDYTDDENPMGQVLKYIEKFREGKAKDIKGRVIPENVNRRFYCYIICDMTPNLRKLAKRSNFNETPDAQGFFLYHSEYSAYIEIVGFDKLLKDAKQRNKAFFDRLSIT